MTKLKEMIENLEKLDGATVNYFGAPHTLPTAPTADEFEIDTLDILRALQGHEIGADYFEYYNEDSFTWETPEDIASAWDSDSWDVDFSLIDTLENYGFIGEEIASHNTYNWSAPLSHHIDYRLYKNEQFGGVFVFLQVHRFGDVRGNYEGFVLLSFDSTDEFYVVAFCENYKYIYLDVDGVLYNIELSPLSDSYEVYSDDGSYICTAYGDREDVISKIREYIA